MASSSDLCLLHRGRDAAPLPAPWLTANCGVGHRPLSRRPHHRPSPQPARLTARHHRLSRRSAILLRPVQSVLTSAVRLELVSMPAVISAHQLPNEAIPSTKNPIHFILQSNVSLRLAFTTGRPPMAITSVPYNGPLTQPNQWPARGGRGTSAKIFRQRQRRAGVFPLPAAGPGTVRETFSIGRSSRSGST